MTCYAPITAYYSSELNPTGKRSLVFDSRKSLSGIPLSLPCGRCIGCKLERSRIWAIRCMHEKRMYTESEFITLTYAPKHLPAGATLVRRDVQLFMKRLRKARFPGIRYFGAGEYGETTARPHYHLLLFNTSFPDRRFHKNGKSGEPLYKSVELDKLWALGDCLTGNVTFESCAYVARYCTKKITGDNADAHYRGRTPEFSMMSLKPGIGSDWYEKYNSEAYKHDSVIMSGRETPIPRYYDIKYETLDPKRLHRLKRLRRLKARLHKDDNTLRRLRVRETLEIRKSKMFKRET